LGHPSQFQWLSRLGFITAATSLNKSKLNFAPCSAVTWAGRLYIHFRWLLPGNGILPGAKFTLHPPSPIGSITARHSSSGHEPNFAALSLRTESVALCGLVRPKVTVSAVSVVDESCRGHTGYAHQLALLLVYISNSRAKSSLFGQSQRWRSPCQGIIAAFICVL